MVVLASRLLDSKHKHELAARSYSQPLGALLTRVSLTQPSNMSIRTTRPLVNHIRTRLPHHYIFPPAGPAMRLSSSASGGSSDIDPKSDPLFIAYCPDLPTTSTASDTGDTYAKRLAVRGEHWRRAQVDKDSGRLCEWGAGGVGCGMRVVGCEMWDIGSEREGLV